MTDVANPYDVGTLSLSATKFRGRWSAWFTGAAILLLNGITARYADTQEWWVHFDPWLIYSFAFPLYVWLLPLVFVKAIHELPRRTALALAVAFEGFWGLMILSGWCSRDAFLGFGWPGPADDIRVRAFDQFNLSEVFWRQIVQIPTPTDPLVREVPGLLALFAYILLALLFVRYGRERNLWQSRLVSVSLPLLFFCPAMILFKLTCSLRYIMAFPETSLNF